MRNSEDKTDHSTPLQSSLKEIEKKLSLIDVKLALQSTIAPTGTIEDEILAREQAELLDHQEELLKMAYNIPVSNENGPERFLKLWKQSRFAGEDCKVPDLLALKVEEHFASFAHH